jgi:hypothetical protein
LNQKTRKGDNDSQKANAESYAETIFTEVADDTPGTPGKDGAKARTEECVAASSCAAYAA